MKRNIIIILAVLWCSSLKIIGQTTIKVLPFNQEYSTGYIGDTEKISGTAEQTYPNFFMFDLSSIPNHATITNINFSYFVYYSSTFGADIYTDIYLMDINTISASYNDLKDSIANEATKVWRGTTYAGDNFGSAWTTATLDTLAEIYANAALYHQDWISLTIKFDSHNWTLEGYDNSFSTPYFEITYTDGVPVSDITVSTVSGSNAIDTHMGALQLQASVLPASPTYDSVLWSMDEYGEYYATLDSTGLLTAKGNGNATITVTATAFDGSGVSQDFDVVISNQGTNVKTKELLFDVFPNPAVNMVNIEFNSDVYHQLEIVNASGIKVFNEANCIGKVGIDISDITPGVYYLIIDENYSNTVSFVKE